LASTLSQGVKNAKPRQYAFSQFQSPACTACNDRFGKLENAAKPIVLKLLALEKLTATEISILLDWLDKIRIGLWLGVHQLDKNFEGIIPRFYVRYRIGRKDRMIILAYGALERQQLSFTGPTTLVFRFLPSAFSLIITDCASSIFLFDYLLGRRLGFPYPSNPLSRHCRCRGGELRRTLALLRRARLRNREQWRTHVAPSVRWRSGWDHEFESPLLQRRVSEPPVPLGTRAHMR
jgi:hypothetical protein